MKVGQFVQFAVANRKNQGRTLVGRLIELWCHIARVRCGNRVYTLDRESVFPIGGES